MTTDHKLHKLCGDLRGTKWDDGYHFVVKKITVYFDKVINGIQFTYIDEYGATAIVKKHGGDDGQIAKIDIDSKNGEYLTKVSGYYGPVLDAEKNCEEVIIKSLTFYTNKNKTYGPYGDEDGISFTTSEGHVVGFHGRADASYLRSIDVHTHDADNTNITRNDFPNGFIFGVGTSAYQHEGGARKGGKGYSGWDVFTLSTPERIVDGSNGSITADMYSRYKEDIKVMKNMGFDAYRFSISWSRILPGGRPCLGINREAIDYYNDIINTCLENGLKPYVTLFHMDLPYCLQQEYGGFLSEEIIDDFVTYAELCFWEFGDRVKHWFTINEPWSYSLFGYADRIFPPGEATASTHPDTPQNKPEDNFIRFRSVDPCLIKPKNFKAKTGQSSTDSDKAKEVYTVARNLLLAHANVVQSYRGNFKELQKGSIGITLVAHFEYPLNETDEEDQKAAIRAIDFMLGWFLEPILYGSYPQNMIHYVPKGHLDPFSPDEASLLKGSIDFLGLNYYTSMYAQNKADPTIQLPWHKDQQVEFTYVRDNVPIGPVAGSPWLYIVPQGIYDLLKHINSTYKNVPDIYITEIGSDEINDPKLTPSHACKDEQKIKYHQDHLAKIRDAMKDFGPKKLNVKGYFLWSWCDNFGWVHGYSVRAGIMYVDFLNHQTRYPKDSAKWLAAKFLKRGGLVLKTQKSLK